jgi:hypothetical protein
MLLAPILSLLCSTAFAVDAAPERAPGWFRRHVMKWQCHRGQSARCLELAELHLSGQWMDVDVNAAETELGAACDQGDALGCLSLGMLIMEQDEDGPWGLPMERACELDSFSACQMLFLQRVFSEQGEEEDPVAPEAARATALAQCAELQVPAIDPQGPWGLSPNLWACEEAADMLMGGTGGAQEIEAGLAMRAGFIEAVAGALAHAEAHPELQVPEGMLEEWADHGSPEGVLQESGQLERVSRELGFSQRGAADLIARQTELQVASCARGSVTGLLYLEDLPESDPAIGRCLEQMCTEENLNACTQRFAWTAEHRPKELLIEQTAAMLQLLEARCKDGVAQGCDELFKFSIKARTRAIPPGFPEDLRVRAVGLFMIAATDVEARCAEGEAAACDLLLDLHVRAIVPGECVPLDRLLLSGFGPSAEACEAGDDEACEAAYYQLRRISTGPTWGRLAPETQAKLTALGVGIVERGLPACEAGDVDACVELTRKAGFGFKLLVGTPFRGLEFQEKACDWGMPSACMDLARGPAHGRLDLPRTLAFYTRPCLELDPGGLYMEEACEGAVAIARQLQQRKLDGEGMLETLAFYAQVCDARGVGCDDLLAAWADPRVNQYTDEVRGTRLAEVALIQGGLATACQRGWPQACRSWSLLDDDPWAETEPGAMVTTGMRGVCDAAPQLERLAVPPPPGVSFEIIVAVLRHARGAEMLPRLEAPVALPERHQVEEAARDARRRCKEVAEADAHDGG